MPRRRIGQETLFQEVPKRSALDEIVTPIDGNRPMWTALRVPDLLWQQGLN